MPPGARVVGGSDFTPIGMLAYDDQPAISIQLHPEFDPAYAQALIEARGDLYATGQADQALASLGEATQRLPARRRLDRRLRAPAGGVVIGGRPE